MSELSPQLEALVMASKRTCLPTAADSNRIQSALRARLGEAAFIGTESAQAAATSATSGILLAKVTLISLAGLALIGGLWFFAARNHLAFPIESKSSRDTETVQEASLDKAPTAVASTTPTAPDRTSIDVAVVGSPALDRNAPPVASHHARDKLAEEVALLSRAETALHNGKPAAALEILNEHERKFGNGLLAEERIAARVQALCALGRTAAADAQLALLSPKSLHGEVSRGACDARPGK